MLKLYLKIWRLNILNKYKIKIYPKAIRELDEIYNYITYETLNLDAAKKLVSDIYKGIMSLETFPNIH